MADLSLDAVLSTREDLTSALDEIAASAETAGLSMTELGSAADFTAESLQDVERAGSTLTESLNDITGSSGITAASLEGVEEQTEDTGDQFLQSAAEASAYRSALAGLGGQELLAQVGVSTPDDLGMPMPDGGTVDIGASMPDISGFNFGEESLAVDVTGTDDLSALTGAGHAAAEGLDATAVGATEASASTALAASRADETGDSFLGAVPGTTALSDALGDVRDSAITLVPGMKAAENSIEEAGDEATSTAAQMGALRGSMAGAGGASSNLSTGMLGLHGSISTVAAAALPLVGILGGLVGPLGAVAAGAGGAGSALAGMFGAGLLSQADQLVGKTVEMNGEMTELESTGDAVEYIFSDIKDQAASILEPLQTARTGQLFQDVVGTGLTIFSNFVTMAESLMEPLFDMTDRLGAAFAIERPRFFSELEGLTRDLIGPLGDLSVWLLGAIPDGLQWVREHGVDLIPVVSELSQSVLGFVVELSEVGSVIWSTFGPALAWTFDLGAGLIDVFTDLPGPIQRAGVVAAGAAVGAWALAGALSGATLSAITLSTVLGAISWPLVAVGALAGGLYLLADRFGLIDGVVSAAGAVLSWFGNLAVGVWNTLIRWTEGFINTILGLSDVLGITELLGGTLNWLGGVFDWLASKVNWVVGGMADAFRGVAQFIGKIFQKLATWIESFLNKSISAINGLATTANRIPGVSVTTLEKVDIGTIGSGGEGGGVDLSGMEFSGGSDSGSGEGSGSGSGDGGGPPTAPSGQSGSQEQYQDNRNYEVNVDARGSDLSEGQVEALVEDAVKRTEDDPRTNQRQRKRNYPNS